MLSPLFSLFSSWWLSGKKQNQKWGEEIWINSRLTWAMHSRWIAEISGRNSCGSILKSSVLIPFQLVQFWPDRSASFEEKEVEAAARCCDKNGKLQPACKQWQQWRRCCSVLNSAWRWGCVWSLWHASGSQLFCVKRCKNVSKEMWKWSSKTQNRKRQITVRVTAIKKNP